MAIDRIDAKDPVPTLLWILEEFTSGEPNKEENVKGWGYEGKRISVSLSNSAFSLPLWFVVVVVYYIAMNIGPSACQPT